MYNNSGVKINDRIILVVSSWMYVGSNGLLTL